MATPEPSTAPSTPPLSPDPRRRDPGRPAGPEAYRSQARRYDRRTDAFRQWRERVVEQLPVRPGDTVLDVGCGTGLCLPLLQSPAVLAHVFAHLRPGAVVAAIGGKWPPSWNVVLRAWVADLHAPFISDFTGFDQPWRLLAGFVPGLRVTELGAGGGYLAVGHAHGRLEHTEQ